MCSCAPASTFNMSSYIGEGRYAVFTSPKSLRPQPVSPERSESWRRGREPAADSTNSHLHLLHHICWRLPLATSRATQRWGQFAPADDPRFSASARLHKVYGWWAHLALGASSLASSRRRRARSTRDTCASCCSKSHESFASCQSFKSDRI